MIILDTIGLTRDDSLINVDDRRMYDPKFVVKPIRKIEKWNEFLEDLKGIIG